MLHYIIQTITFQLFFLMVYDLFLKKETFFNWNRIYLLITAILSVTLPFIKIDGLKKVVPNDYIITLPEIILGQSNVATSPNFSFDLTHLSIASGWSWVTLLYIGALVMLAVFLFKLTKLVLLIYKNPKQWKENLIIVKLLNSNAAFSFFHYVFLGEDIKTEDKESILSHEQVHVEQKHTLDLLLFEVLRVLFWFNPLIYMYQNRIASLHEFIADEKASKNNNTEYYENLLAQVFHVQCSSIINPFFKQSLIKKRIIMLSKSKSKQINLFKYALLLPMVIGMLVYTSCADEKEDMIESSATTTEKVSETNDASPLITKINAMKSQIQIQGKMSDNESYGIELLLKTIQSETLDTDLIKEVQTYIDAENKTVLEEKIAAVFDQIQVQGQIQDHEYRKFKTFLLLTTKDGFENPFFNDVIQYAEIPFGVIDNVPVFPGCENESNKKACFINNMNSHVMKRFNVKLAEDLNLEGEQRIMVKFIIDTNGNIIDIVARAPHPELENEAIRVIKSLPKMHPGTLQGKAVKVPFSLPIKFLVQE